jgi:hypothetical protein
MAGLPKSNNPLVRRQNHIELWNQQLATPCPIPRKTTLRRSRSDTALEVLALRQQVAVLKRKRPRPALNRLDRFFWTRLSCWPLWAEVLVIVKPETVIGWHRAGFRLYWCWHSGPRSGRPKSTEEIRELIRAWGKRMPTEERLRSMANYSSWASSLRTDCGSLSAQVGCRGDSGKKWLAFLRNPREAIVGLDLFTVPMAPFRALYCLFVIGHGRRRILDCNGYGTRADWGHATICAKRFRRPLRIATSFWIETRSLTTRSLCFWALSRNP